MKRVLLFWAAAAFALALTGCASNAEISKNMLTLSPQSLKMRQLETKRFDTSDEKMMLAASASVLQDLGFQLDETNPTLGVLVGSKQRDATDAGQVTLAIFVAALGGGTMPVDKEQTIRVSLVTAPMPRPKDPTAPKPKRITPEMVKTACEHVDAAVQQSLQAEFAQMLAPTEAQKAAGGLSTQFAKMLKLDLTERMKNQDLGATRVRVTFQRLVVNTQGMATHMEPLQGAELYQHFFERLSKSVFLEANDI